MTDEAPPRDRGQLILVGAVSIALVLMGLVAVFNTVLFTETTSPTESIESSGEARSLTQQVVNDTEEIMFRVANESDPSQAGDFPGYLQENVSKYSELLGNSYAHTGPVYVKVTVPDTSPGTNWDTTSNTLSTNVSVTYRTREFEFNTTVEVETAAP